MPSKANVNPLVPDVTAVQTTSAKFKINNAKLYVELFLCPKMM